MPDRYVVELEFKRIGDLGVEQLNAKTRRLEDSTRNLKRDWSTMGNAHTACTTSGPTRTCTIG